MSRIEVYREWYEQEKDANAKLLSMLDSVPESARSAPEFARACVLAAHLAACRENWLDRMASTGEVQTDWWPESAAAEDLPSRFARVEAAWTGFLVQLKDDDLDVDFEFPVTGGRYRWNIEGQIRQLIGHGFYHRGQIAQLVDRLGGTAVDTDYLYWAFERAPERWRRLV